MEAMESFLFATELIWFTIYGVVSGSLRKKLPQYNLQMRRQKEFPQEEQLHQPQKECDDVTSTMVQCIEQNYCFRQNTFIIYVIFIPFLFIEKTIKRDDDVF